MKKLTTEQFLFNFSKRYPDNLGLDMSLFVYKKATITSIVSCQKHQIQYLATPDSLYGGHKGCAPCNSENISKRNKMTFDEFIERSRSHHGNYYDYSKVEWFDSGTRITIICPKHGEFQQLPQGHYLAGNGCSKCGYKTLRTAITAWIESANSIHINQYDYSEVDYVNNYTPIKIICTKHGPFSMLPKIHTLEKRGCPRCYLGNKSYKETAWLNSLGIPHEHRQIKIKIKNKNYIVDAKIGSTVYEFWGDFWHGNPKAFRPGDINSVCGKSFKELYEATERKRESIQNAGFDLIEMWESDYSVNGT